MINRVNALLRINQRDKCLSLSYDILCTSCRISWDAENFNTDVKRWLVCSLEKDRQLNSILNYLLNIQLLLIVDSTTLRAPLCSHWLTSQAGHQWNCLKQESIVIISFPYTVVQAMDPHLVTDTIFTSQATPHPTHILTQTLDTATVHHLAIVIPAPSPNHSWLEVTLFSLMKLKCFMKLFNINLLNQVR